ncbi:MAG TPA: hypothetical protein VK208_00455 [Pyrinomonadaceae bacterium]|nr:hypothetical protein [Pyrinomonadaceae bacterium]
MDIFLMGPPGSGKSTQVALVTERVRQLQAHEFTDAGLMSSGVVSASGFASVSESLFAG